MIVKNESLGRSLDHNPYNFQRCWDLPSKPDLRSESDGFNPPMYLELMKAIQNLERKRKHCKCHKHKKGKSVPGKNLSKNSQTDGNDDDAMEGSSKWAKRSAAKNARQMIAEQTQLTDDKDYDPNGESESGSEESYESNDSSVSEEFHSAQSEANANKRLAAPIETKRDETRRDEPKSEGRHDETRRDGTRLRDFQGPVEHCWVESFEVDINSKRLDQFSIPSESIQWLSN